MCTACTSPYGESLWQRFPMDRDPLDRNPQTETPLTETPWQRPLLDRDPQTETPKTEIPLDRDPPGQRLPRTETSWTEIPLDRDPPGQRSPWTETPRERPPTPVNRITDRRKNITLLHYLFCSWKMVFLSLTLTLHLLCIHFKQLWFQIKMAGRNIGVGARRKTDSSVDPVLIYYIHLSEVQNI